MELGREQILEALGRIALSSPNDAVTLAMEGKDCYVKDLDLWGVSELKVAGNGGVEIKFADRVKAISLLLECLGGGEDGMAACWRHWRRAGENQAVFPQAGGG